MQGNILNPQSLYIHIPFCRNKCNYCGFYSIPHDSNKASSYIDTISAQIVSLECGFRTIYIGGGTPSALDVSQLKKLLKTLRKHSRETSEFTIEANPESLGGDKLSLFMDEGVNRISIGAQSFNDDKLKKLGRVHDSAKAEEAVELARAKGFKNIGLDLIFGVPAENPESWKSDLDRAISLSVEHISCYGLTHDKDLMPIDDDTMAAMYNMTIADLEDAGYRQYEISSFSKSGYRCRHNLNYWDNEPYIGLGPSAVSYVNGVREERVSDVEEYIRKARTGDPFVASEEELSPEKRARETAAVKIRVKEGIDFGWFKKKTGMEFMELEKEAITRLTEDGLVEVRSKGVRLTKKGISFCDIVSSGFV